MNADHFQAVWDRLDARPALAGKLRDSYVTRDADGQPIKGVYVVVYGGSPDVLESGRAFAEQRPDSDAEFVYTVRSVAPTAAGCRAAQAQVSAQLVGHTPTVAGRTTYPIRLTLGDEVTPDDDMSPPLYFADDEYTLRSTRA